MSVPGSAVPAATSTEPDATVGAGFPKVSVIVPTYAPGDRIERVARSLAGQTMPATDFEVIFVDDGSPDDTWSRLEQIRDQHDNVRIERIENSGWPSRPRNVGLDLARGEYVLFMDHDDELYPHALEAGYAMASRNNADVLNGKETRTDQSKWALDVYTADMDNAIDRTDIHPLIPTNPHKLFRRAFLIEHGIRFPEGRRVLWEDVFFCLDVARHAEVISVLSSTPFYHWVRDGVTASTSYGTDRMEYWQQVRKIVVQIGERLADRPGQARLMLQWQYLNRVLPQLQPELFAAPADELAAVQELVEDVVDRIPVAFDDGLSPQQLGRAALVRARRWDLLATYVAVDFDLVGISTATSVYWSHGALEVVAETRWAAGAVPLALREQDGRLERDLPADVVAALPGAALDMTAVLARAGTTIGIRARSGGVNWLLPTQVRRRVDTIDRRPVLIVTATATLDPRRAVFGRPLDADSWDFTARNELGGVVNQRRLRSGLAPRPGWRDGHLYIAYKSQAGMLSLDIDQIRRRLVGSAPLDPAQARVTAAAAGVRVEVPFRWAATSDDSSLDAVVRLGGTPVPAVVAARSDGLWLSFTAPVEPGTYPLGVELFTGPANDGGLDLEVTGAGEVSLHRRDDEVAPALPRAPIAEELIPAAQPATTPRVSIVVATYGPGPGLHRLLASLDAQTLPQSEFETIFVDDGSPDSTWPILKTAQAARSNMTVQRMPNSGWPSKPRNVGIELARGEFVLFMDHDDEIFPDGLRAAVDYAREHRLDVVSAKEVKTSSPGFGFEAYDHDSAGSTAEMGVMDLVPMMPHKLYRRQLLIDHKVRFPEGRRMLWEDVYFNVDAFAAAARVGTMGHTAVYRRIMGKSNASNSYRPVTEEFWQKLLPVFAHIDTVLAGAEFADDRAKLMLHQYRGRVLTSVCALLQHGHDDKLAMAMPYIRLMHERFVPASAGASLTARDRSVDRLLRAQDVDGLRAAALAIARVVGLSATTSVEWDGDALRVVADASWTLPPSVVEPGFLAPTDDDDRAAVASELARVRCDLVLLERESKETTGLPTDQTVLLSDPDEPLRPLAVRVVSRIGVDARARSATFDVQAHSAALGFVNQRGLRTPAAATMVGFLDGQILISYRNRSGMLTVDYGQNVRSAVNSAPADLDAVTVRTRRFRSPVLTLPLDGVHIHGTTRIEGAAVLEPVEPISPAELPQRCPAALVGDTGGARLEIVVRARPGRYRLSFDYTGRLMTSPFVLTVPAGAQPPALERP